jgi:hypothetical protein
MHGADVAMIVVAGERGVAANTALCLNAGTVAYFAEVVDEAGSSPV